MVMGHFILIYQGDDRVWGLGFRGLGFQGFVLRVWGSSGLGSRVEDIGFWG